VNDVDDDDDDVEGNGRIDLLIRVGYATVQYGYLKYLMWRFKKTVS
jgi:hypothetical protein